MDIDPYIGKLDSVKTAAWEMIGKLVDKEKPSGVEELERDYDDLKAALKWLVFTIKTNQGIELETKPRLTVALSQVELIKGKWGGELEANALFFVEHSTLGELGIELTKCKIRKSKETGKMRFFQPFYKVMNKWSTNVKLTEGLANMYLNLGFKSKYGKRLREIDQFGSLDLERFKLDE